MTHGLRYCLAVVIGALLLAVTSHAFAASASVVQVLETDLAPRIAAAAKHRERFAVSVPHSASIDHSGSWETAGGISVWRYAVRIPTAVSLSFHASRFDLPEGATLTVVGNDRTRATYTRQSATGELWGRIQRGDALSFELRVAEAARPEVRFVLSSLQAGYRVLGGDGSADHPYYRQQQKVSQATSPSSCARNFSCEETAQNEKNADATAAIVLDGVALCSATLINNLRKDGTAYLLTARHCQVNPEGGVVVYWDAVSPCGSVLGNVYDVQTSVNYDSVRTVFEQQDVWLLRLNRAINSADPYFAGWDATGGSFVGGYGIHHASGRSKQYVGWFGQAASVTLPAAALGVGFDSTYWGVVNAIGTVGSGASGSGLFNPEHRLVGVASLANIQESGDGVCPVATPPAPDSESAVALYNSLAAVWDTNADSTSFTNPVTLKSLLDPDNTGARTVDGLEPLGGVSFFARSSSAFTGQSVTLNWSAPAGVSCTASGGVAGDGWSGARTANGTFDVTSYNAGVVQYDLGCTDGARSATHAVRVAWNESAPSLILSGSTGVFLGQTTTLQWSANLQSCTASGGVPGDGWAGAKAPRGSQAVTSSQVGQYVYSLTCGSGARSVTESVTVQYSAPFATLEANSNNMRVGNPVLLLQTAGGSCLRTGGAPGDGWAGSTQAVPMRVTATTPGTYRYMLTCSGGPTPAVATVDLTFTSAAPVATLTASKTSAEVHPAGPVSALGPEALIDFTWNSNIAPCGVSVAGPGAEGSLTSGVTREAHGTISSGQSVTGSYTYSVRCDNGTESATASTIVEFVPAAPRVSLQVQSERIAANEPFDISWFSNAGPCTASGGAAADGWAGAKNLSGLSSLVLTTPGIYSYTMTCGTAPGVVSTTVAVTLPEAAVSFDPHPTQTYVGRGVALRWTGTVGPCALSGDWNSPTAFPATGGNVVIGNSVGTRTYGLRCGTSSIVEATTQVTFVPLPVVDITASSTRVAVNTPVTLSWSSNDAASCTASSPSGADDWNGLLPTSGTRVITRSTPASVGFYIDCDGVSDVVIVEFYSPTSSPPTASPPSLSFSIDQPTRVSGEAVTLTWTTTRAAGCRGGGGVNGDGWSGAKPVSGTLRIVVTGSGTFTWHLTCSGAPPAASASVTATYSAAPPTNPPPSGGGGTGNGGSGGGGGRLDLSLFALLALLLCSHGLRWAGRDARAASKQGRRDSRPGPRT